MGRGESGEDEGQEGAEASIEDGRPDVPQSLDCPLISGAWDVWGQKWRWQIMMLMPDQHFDVTFVTNEIVSHMSCIVNTEAHGDDQVDAGHHVYGQAPEVNKSSNIDLQNILIYRGFN